MSDQDWKVVTLRKKVVPQQKVFEEGHKKNIDLLSDDPSFPKYLGKDNAQKIQQARINKKLTQVELGKKLNIQASIIKSYEVGNVVPEKKILRQISNYLNIKVDYK